MNAPTQSPPAISALHLTQIIDSMVAHWCDGRSIAGIQLEIQTRYGLRVSPRRIWQRISERAKRDPNIPRALYHGAQFAKVDLLDQRANLTEQWAMDRALILAMQLMSLERPPEEGGEG